MSDRILVQAALDRGFISSQQALWAFESLEKLTRQGRMVGAAALLLHYELLTSQQVLELQEVVRRRSTHSEDSQAPSQRRAAEPRLGASARSSPDLEEARPRHIVVSCTCGKSFFVPADQAGKTGRCTVCGSRITVSEPSEHGGSTEGEPREASEEQLESFGGGRNQELASRYHRTVFAPFLLADKVYLLSVEAGGLYFVLLRRCRMEDVGPSRLRRDIRCGSEPRGRLDHILRRTEWDEYYGLFENPDGESICRAIEERGGSCRSFPRRALEYVRVVGQFVKRFKTEKGAERWQARAENKAGFARARFLKTAVRVRGRERPHSALMESEAGPNGIFQVMSEYGLPEVSLWQRCSILVRNEATLGRALARGAAKGLAAGLLGEAAGSFLGDQVVDIAGKLGEATVGKMLDKEAYSIFSKRIE